MNARIETAHYCSICFEGFGEVRCSVCLFGRSGHTEFVSLKTEACCQRPFRWWIPVKADGEAYSVGDLSRGVMLWCVDESNQRLVFLLTCCSNLTVGFHGCVTAFFFFLTQKGNNLQAFISMRAQRRWSHALFSGASLPVQEALGASWNREGNIWTSGSTSLPCGQLSTGTGCPHRLWCLLLGHLQNPPGPDMLCVALLDPGGWTRRPTEVPSNFSHSLK